MEAIKSQFVALLTRNSTVISVLAIENPNQAIPLVDGFDLLLLVVSGSLERVNYTSHYSKDDYRIQERWIDPAEMEAWILTGENRNIIQWIIQGEILLDRNAYLERVRQRLLEFPQPLRERKLLVEFSFFLRRYLQSKEYLRKGHILDAYSNILEALHHWARIVIIEAGAHPEVIVWNQVRVINPGVYKMYEELTQSSETVKQRVQLVLLACEFSVMSKMGTCCTILLRLLESREEPWDPAELARHPDLKDLHVEISLILKKLVKKSLIKEVGVIVGDDVDLLELRYTN